MANGFVAIDKLILDMELRASNATRGMKKVDYMLKDIDKKTKKTNDGLQKMEKFLLGVGLSALFTGMALKNLAQNMLKSLVTAFVTARDEGDYFVNQILGMQAAFEFLKFAIFDAFAQTDLFRMIVESFISITNAVSGFVSQHPAIASIVVLFLGLAIVVGAVLMVVGQLALSMLAITAFAEVFGMTSWASFGNASKGALLFLGKLALAATAALAVVAIAFVLKTIWLEVFKAIGIRVEQFKTVVVAVADRIKTNLQLLGLSIKVVFLSIAKAIVDSINKAISFAVDMINIVIRAYNRIPFVKNIPEISFGGIDTSGLSNNITETVNEMGRLFDAYEARATAAGTKLLNLNAQLALNRIDAGEKLKGAFGAINPFSGGNTEQNTMTNNVVQNNNFVVNSASSNGSFIIDDIDNYMKEANDRLLGSPNGG